MPYSLISLHEEMRLFLKLISFYSKLYPDIKFSKLERMLNPKEVGEILYTYAGDEIEPIAADKMREMEEALYNNPVPGIALQKGKELILLDGHRRLRLAWKRGLGWKMLIIVPNRKAKFAIENSIIGRIKELY